MADNTLNRYGVGQGLGESIYIQQNWILRTPITRESALNLAAWLLAVADAPLAFEHASVTVDVDDKDRRAVTAVLSREFVELLGRVQQS